MVRKASVRSASSVSVQARRSGWLTAKQAAPGQAQLVGASPTPGALSAPTGLPSFAAAVVTPAVQVRRPGHGSRVAGGWAWAHRWQLTPVAALVVVLAGVGKAPAAATAVLVAAAGGLWWWTTRTPAAGRRKWLSSRERRVAATWTTGAAVAALVVALGAPVMVAAVGLGAGTVPAGWVWVASRRIRPAKARGLSANARAIRDGWARWADTGTLRALAGSRVVETTEPTDGTIVLRVELGPTIHAHTAATSEVRRGLERAMRMPLGTVDVLADPDDSSMVQVVLTPHRTLQQVSRPWPGPVLHHGETGLVPVAVDSQGQEISVALWKPDGIEHLILVGTTGAGKSNATAVLLTPGPLAGVEAVIYLDGKRGQSASRLAAILTKVVTDPAGFAPAIEAVHAVMADRTRRYALVGVDQWTMTPTGGGPTGHDPIVTLVLEEAKSINAALSERHRGLVGEIAQQGRSVGVRLIQVVHDPRGADVVGGKVARDLMAGGGSVLALRPGGSTAARLAMDSTSQEIDLTALPPQPGWCAIVRRGQVLAAQARIMQVDTTTLTTALANARPPALSGADLDAAGHWWVTAPSGRDITDLISVNRDRIATGQQPLDLNQWLGRDDNDRITTGHPTGQARPGLNASAAAAAAAAEDLRQRIRTHLATGPASRAELVAATGASRAAVGRALDALADQKNVTPAAGRWALTDPTPTPDTPED